MKRVLPALFAGAALLAAAVLSGCSIRQAAFNSAADMLAPPPVTKPAKASAEKKSDPMLALTGENDPELVRDFFPTALKLYEIMHLQNPGHEGTPSSRPRQNNCRANSSTSRTKHISARKISI